MVIELNPCCFSWEKDLPVLQYGLASTHEMVGEPSGVLRAVEDVDFRERSRPQKGA